MAKISTSAFPWLPTELLEVVLSHTWSMSLSVDERITLMTSSLLVNKNFFATFVRVSSRDVYIPCASYADQFLRLLRKDSPIYTKELAPLADSLCTSITFQITNPHPSSLELYSEKSAEGDCISHVFQIMDILCYVPHLRRLCIEYTNWGTTDIFDHHRLLLFPESVVALDIAFKFTREVPLSVINDMCESHPRHEDLFWVLPNIHILTVKGAGPAVAGDFLQRCPNVCVAVIDCANTMIATKDLGPILPIPVSLREIRLIPQPLVDGSC